MGPEPLVRVAFLVKILSYAMDDLSIAMALRRVHSSFKDSIENYCFEWWLMMASRLEHTNQLCLRAKFNNNENHDGNDGDDVERKEVADDEAIMRGYFSRKFGVSPLTPTPTTTRRQKQSLTPQQGDDVCVFFKMVEHGISWGVHALVNGGELDADRVVTTTGATPLLVAVMAGQLDVAKVLVEHASVPEKRSDVNWTRNLLVDRLVAATTMTSSCGGGNINNNNTIRHLVTQHLSDEGVQTTRAKRRRVMLADIYSPLLAAVSLQNVDMVRYLLSKPMIELTVTNSDHRTAMHLAVQSFSGFVFQFCLSQVDDDRILFNNDNNNQLGGTKMKIIELLLLVNAPPLLPRPTAGSVIKTNKNNKKKKRSSSGDDVLGDDDTEATAAAAFNILTAQDARGKTPLHFLCQLDEEQDDNVAIVRRLVENMSPEDIDRSDMCNVEGVATTTTVTMNSHNSSSSTAMTTTTTTTTPIVRITARSTSRTALMIAIQSENLKMADILLDHGADPCVCCASDDQTRPLEKPFFALLRLPFSPESENIMRKMIMYGAKKAAAAAAAAVSTTSSSTTSTTTTTTTTTNNNNSFISSIRQNVGNMGDTLLLAAIKDNSCKHQDDDGDGDDDEQATTIISETNSTKILQNSDGVLIDGWVSLLLACGADPNGRGGKSGSLNERHAGDSQPPILAAIRAQDLATIRLLVHRYGVSLNQRIEVSRDVNRCASTPLIESIPGRVELFSSFGSFKVCRFLLCDASMRAHCDVNYPDEDGATPLHHAAEHGHLGIVKALLLSPSDGDDDHDDHKKRCCCKLHVLRRTDGATALWLAARNGHLDVVRFLVQKFLATTAEDADSSSKKSSSPSPSSLSSGSSNKATIATTFVSCPNRSGVTSLQVTLLCDTSALKRAVTSKMESELEPPCPSMLASRSSDLDVDNNINNNNNNNKDAGDDDVVGDHDGHGHDEDDLPPSPPQQQPAAAAAIRKQIELASFLVQSGCHIIHSSSSLPSCLHFAVRSHSVEMVEWTLNQMKRAAEAEEQQQQQQQNQKQNQKHQATTSTAALIDAPDQYGETALHAALSSEFVVDGIVEMLLDKGARPDATSFCGATPLLLAILRKKTKLALTILSRLVELRKEDSDNKTAEKQEHHHAHKNDDDDDDDDDGVTSSFRSSSPFLLSTHLEQQITSARSAEYNPNNHVVSGPPPADVMVLGQTAAATGSAHHRSSHHQKSAAAASAPHFLTALTAAARSGLLEVVKKLLQLGADPNAASQQRLWEPTLVAAASRQQQQQQQQQQQFPGHASSKSSSRGRHNQTQTSSANNTICFFTPLVASVASDRSVPLATSLSVFQEIAACPRFARPQPHELHALCNHPRLFVPPKLAAKQQHQQQQDDQGGDNNSNDPRMFKIRQSFQDILQNLLLSSNINNDDNHHGAVVIKSSKQQQQQQQQQQPAAAAARGDAGKNNNKKEKVYAPAKVRRRPGQCDDDSDDERPTVSAVRGRGRGGGGGSSNLLSSSRSGSASLCNINNSGKNNTIMIDGGDSDDAVMTTAQDDGGVVHVDGGNALAWDTAMPVNNNNSTSAQHQSFRGGRGGGGGGRARFSAPTHDHQSGHQTFVGGGDGRGGRGGRGGRATNHQHQQQYQDPNSAWGLQQQYHYSAPSDYAYQHQHHHHQQQQHSTYYHADGTYDQNYQHAPQAGWGGGGGGGRGRGGRGRGYARQ